MKVSVDFRDFARLHQDVEAIIQRCGVSTWDCVLVDVEGAWTRGVFLTKEAAEEVCRDLEVRTHDGWDDPRIARRMSRYDAWSRPDGRRRAL